MTEELVKMKVNKSKSYLIPLLNTEVKLQYIEYLVNSYININGWKECIVLLYDYDILLENNCAEYLKYLREHKLFISASRLENHLLFVFKFPEEYLQDYYSFKEGAYSLIRQSSKTKIIEFISKYYQYPDIVQELVHILYKNKQKKEQLEEKLGIKLSDNCELSSKINEEE